MGLLLDTHVLAWFGRDDPRLSQRFRDILLDPDAEMLISAVTAFEFEDLRARGRFGEIGPLNLLVSALNATAIDYPAGAMESVSSLALHHRDPIDRMLVAHAIHARLPLMTADRTIRLYPVEIVW